MVSLRNGTSPEQVYTWAREHPWLADALLAAVLSALLLPTSVMMIAPSVPPGWWVMLCASLLAVHAALFVRRVRPVVSFTVVSAALAVQTLAPLSAYRYDSAFLASAAAFPVVLYSLCAYGPPWCRGLGVAVGVTGSVLLMVRAVRVFPSDTATTPGGPAAWAFLLGVLLVVVLASWGLARLRQVRLAYFDLLEERARRAEADREGRARVTVIQERARIAREMHDIVAHSLAVIVTQAQGGELVAAKSPERAAIALGTIATTGRLALADMRRLLGVLRAEGPGSTGSGPQPTLADLPQLLDQVRAAGLTVRRTDDGTPRPVGSATELTAYRLVQESLTNTLRHAGSSACADLRLTWSAHELIVTVGDDGRGATTPGNTAGHGLIGMRERVAVLDGKLTAGPKPGGGFEVRAVLPTAYIAAADGANGQQR
ncbi:sensor histidine kinase [Actinoplanes sp. NEAU-A12]|uniref:histidine kinase n=1 Tax=Actinoplanes sandaracinus TaxID=3045177 RepID=A0ABT6WPG1_9ACTN|nr:sensor histidine kinase [Actinoplanes sandaracinus]MDI6101540.1 sensor histidine kinase [Actinoplanes sandaracinus]